ncbi:ParA family protein [Actinomadura spongiicola]|uniref:ParA family protein n=1 Tax=Actinomadura spongiicola TaxID=2303421 RepID=A0A372GLN2_9ACTN|nr:ParA family protein [Actinomadura spongiicola]RFS85963.1 ParA family protein [Actinomadura spongiicola]
MALYCLVSPGGSPGVTTTALGLALTWPGRVLLAECDPMGRRVLPGYLADRMREPAGPGLLGITTTDANDSNVSVRLEQCVVPLDDDGHAELLHGIRDPRHTARLTALWPLVAGALATRDGDVIADLGRVGGAETPVALLEAANVVIVVLKPTLAQVDAVRPRLDVLRSLVSSRGEIGLCLIGDGPYSAAEIKRLLRVPVLAELPHSPADAQVLSDGARPRRTFRTCLLVRCFNRMGHRLRVPTETTPMPSGAADTTEVARRAEAHPIRRKESNDGNALDRSSIAHSRRSHQ